MRLHRLLSAWMIVVACMLPSCNSKSGGQAGEKPLADGRSKHNGVPGYVLPEPEPGGLTIDFLEGTYEGFNESRDRARGKYDGKIYPVIIEVAQGGIADRAGIKKGDIWLSYNGIDLADQKQDNDVIARSIKDAATRGQTTVAIVVVRENQKINCDVGAGMKLGVRFRVVTDKR